MDQDSIERIRSATFPVARRGYEKREVDRFLLSLAEWLETGGADQGRSDAVRRELERVGEETSKILTEAHDVAERLRLQAEREAEGLTEGAQAQADRTRAEADKILAEAESVAETAAQKLRTDADAYATQTRPTPTARPSRRSPRRAPRRSGSSTRRTPARQDIEAVIADLEARRDEVLGSLERLSSELSGTATQHAKAIAERAADTAAKAKDEDGASPQDARARGARATSTRRRRCLRANPPLRLAVWLRPGTERTTSMAALYEARSGGRTRAPPREDRRAGQAAGTRAGRAAGRPGSFAEEALLANWEEEGLGADGVVTGLADVGGRKVALMANDPTVKAGSWGPKTVEKILRIQERALRLELPMVYLVDSAGARITDQVQMFPGRRGAGRIFYNEVVLSGRVPQVCLLFGPSAAGGAYIPAFCDVVIMRDGNASMYLGSPRMAEMVIGEKVTLEEMGGASMHTSVSGCGHFLVKSDEEAIDLAKRYLSYMPQSWRDAPPPAPPAEPASEQRVSEIVPADENAAFDVVDLIDALVDAESFCEVHARWAKELVVGFARLDGRAIGIVANQPKVKGGVLFVDSADKAARFIWTCNAFNVPLLFLADVPGFMIGTQVERQGIIRHGAKMISAVSEATVPKISVIVRKAYGAGLYAMAGPAFEPDCCIALPTASIAVMGPEAAINAVFYNQIQEIADDAEREEFVRAKRDEYAADIDILHLASELVVDAVIEPDELRAELIRRFALAEQGPPLQRAAKSDHPGVGRLAAGKLPDGRLGIAGRRLRRRPGCR